MVLFEMGGGRGGHSCSQRTSIVCSPLTVLTLIISLNSQGHISRKYLGWELRRRPIHAYKTENYQHIDDI